MKIKVYSKTVCPYCTKAKNWLKTNGYEYDEINLEEGNNRAEFLEKYADRGFKTVPQIFSYDETTGVDIKHFGGYDDLIKYVQEHGKDILN